MAVNGKRLTYDEVKKVVESKEHMLLSTDYKNATSILDVMCRHNHKYSTTFTGFRRGKGCGICSGKVITLGVVKEFVEKYNYTLLSDSYNGIFSRIHLLCPNGHDYMPTFNDFKCGCRCSICNGGIRLELEQVKSAIESNTGYILLSDSYTNNRQKLVIKCPKGHIYSAIYNLFQQGGRCPMCSNKTSKGERDMSLFVESFNIPIVKNDRTQIINPLTGYNLELDVWIPSINKAIEYNGLYWHSLQSKALNDKIKQEQCKQLGIDLLIVKEHNWINNNEFEREIIRRFING